MDIANLLLSAVVGAVFGALASIGTASRIAAVRERVREREDARRAVLSEVRVYRAAVAGSRGLMGRGPRQSPLTEDAARAFAEEVVRRGTDLPRKQRRMLLRRLSTLVGAAPALASVEVAHHPVDARAEQWRADTYLRIAGRVPDGEKLSHGLIGRAHQSDHRNGADEAVAELDALIRDLGGQDRWDW